MACCPHGCAETLDWLDREGEPYGGGSSACRRCEDMRAAHEARNNDEDGDEDDGCPAGAPWPNGRPPHLDRPVRPYSEAQKQRALKRVARIDMPNEARREFSSMCPNFAMLEEYECKVERLSSRFQDEQVVPMDSELSNTMSSTAGAGSSDFHEYRQNRRKERARLGAAHAEARRTKEREQWEAEQADREAEEQKKTAKRAAKRQRQKAARRDSTSSTAKLAATSVGAEARAEAEPAADRKT